VTTLARLGCPIYLCTLLYFVFSSLVNLSKKNQINWSNVVWGAYIFADARRICHGCHYKCRDIATRTLIAMYHG